MNNLEIARKQKNIGIPFVLFVLCFLAAYVLPLSALFRFAYNDGTFSYIVIVPPVSFYLLYADRKSIFAVERGNTVSGYVFLAGAAILYFLGRMVGGGGSNTNHFFIGLSAVCFLAGAIGIIWGKTALKNAAFPLAFLLFMAPFPPFLIDPVIRFLQACSAEASYIFFKLTGVPVYRDGFLFHLPGISIEVAKECSGIRSSLSLFLVSLLAGHLTLRDNWRKGILSLTVIPITIVKNAVRIVTLSLLAVYVDPRALGTVAHRRGGIPIFLLALLLLGCVLWLLRRGESKETPQ